MNDRVENGLRMARSEAGVGGGRLAVGKEKGREMNQILPHCGSQPLTATRQPLLPVMGRGGTTCCPSGPNHFQVAGGGPGWRVAGDDPKT